VMATWEHLSDAGLCHRNDGLNNFGVKIGYSF
jgi:lipid A 3-O-deacylase